MLKKVFKTKKVIMVVAFVLLLVLLAGGGYAVYTYYTFYHPNIYITSGESAERSSAERSSAEKSSAERSSAERSSVEKSSAERSSAERSSVEKSSVEKSSVERSSAEKSSVEHSSAEKSSAEKSSAERSSAEKSSVEHSSVEKSSVEHSSVEKSSAEKSSAEKSSAERSSAEKPSAERSSAEKSSTERPSAEKSSAERSSAEKSSAEHSSEAEALYIFVPSGASFSTLMDSLDAKGCLRHRNAFIRAAKKENLPERVKGGRYRLTTGMNNKTVVRLFALGLQTPVRMVISGNIRTVGRLVVVLSRSLEADSISMHQILTNDSLIGAYGFDSTSLFSMVLPNTYELYWNTPPEKVLERLHKEYRNWWSDDRQKKAQSIGLTPFQVATLAAIVQEETNYQPEMATIAGVYMNRLKMGMPLQADPTLKFALRDPTIRRVLNKDTQVESPYNTYKYKGLPPGPICVPSIATLEAVLNYQTHNYLYFCASPDFNGSHRFAANYSDHLRNARAYQQALTQRGIKR